MTGRMNGKVERKVFCGRKKAAKIEVKYINK